MVARRLGEGASLSPPPPSETQRRVVIGDPQASLSTFLEILAHNDLLSDEGWLRPEVQLISVGDHFDWGSAAEREGAAEDGLSLLSWLRAHEVAQVVLIAGNHDLGRVGEMAEFSDEEFLRAHQQALLAYRSGNPDPVLEAALLRQWAGLPSAELAARDFAAFSVAQRDLVADLLRSGRFRLAWAVTPNALVCHAGITRTELMAVGYDGTQGDAVGIAQAINSHFDRAIASWKGLGRLRIESLHVPGDATFGEGGGMLYHRPANLGVTSEPATYSGPGHRRYDPRNLPLGLTQIVGHISDAKCRSLFGSWAHGNPGPGRIRNLVTNGEEVRYQVGSAPLAGPADEARLLFVDGGMSRVPPEEYELLTL